MLETVSRHRFIGADQLLSSGRRVVLLQTQAEGAGAQEVSRILGNGLTQLGYDVHSVFCFRRTAAFDDHPNTFFCVRERPRGPLSLIRMAVALVRHLRTLRPDAVLTFQHYGNLIGTVAGRAAGVRTIIVNRNSAKSLIPSWAKRLDLAFGLGGWFQSIVVNSSSVEQEYESYPDRYRNRITRIDHGFVVKASKLSQAEARFRYELPANATLLGTAARLHPLKNIQAGIRLLPGRDWHLAVAGQGSSYDELVDLARALGVRDRVHFLGELAAQEIGHFLRALDVFVFPSVAETFGLAVVEAAHSGVPVVSNDLEVLREVLATDGGPCAVFVDVDDESAFSIAVDRVLKDSSCRKSLASSAKQLSERYSLQRMVRQYSDLIEATIARRGHCVRSHPGTTAGL